MAIPLENIDRALAATGLPDSQLADVMGVTKQAIRGWRDTGRIGHVNLSRLSELSGIPTNEIVGTSRISEPIHAYSIKTDEDDAEDGDVTVDVVEIELSAGSGAATHEFVETRYRHTYRAAYLRSIGVKPENVRRCRVTGDSMERILFDGDLVSIDISNKRLVDDAVYAIVIADQLKVKRLRRRRDGGLLVVSENEARFPIEEFPAEELHAIHIVGRAFDKSGKGGL